MIGILELIFASIVKGFIYPEKPMYERTLEK